MPSLSTTSMTLVRGDLMTSSFAVSASASVSGWCVSTWLSFVLNSVPNSSSQLNEALYCHTLPPPTAHALMSMLPHQLNISFVDLAARLGDHDNRLKESMNKIQAISNKSNNRNNGSKSLILLDSVSNLVQDYGSFEAIKFLRELAKLVREDRISVIALDAVVSVASGDSDTHSFSVQSAVDSYFSSVLELFTPITWNNTALPLQPVMDLGQCAADNIVFVGLLNARKKSGKTTKQTLLLKLQSNGVADFVVDTKPYHLNAPLKKKPVANKDPTQNLSFNLSLTEQQRASRDDTVLPYTEVQFTPESDKMWEYEEGEELEIDDPDDDLDI